MPPPPAITAASDRALLISFGQALSEAHHRQVRLLLGLLKHRPDLHLREIQPAYSSILLTFDLLQTSLDQLTAALQPMLAEFYCDTAPGEPLPTRRLEIPICYDPSLAPDLAEVARLTGLSLRQVVHLHASASFTVCFFGFMPGFAYWSGLPEKLAVPRLSSPRPRVPSGSVAIGGNQTGIYPLETPGGWRIIGRTPLAIFDAARDPPCLLQLGDRIRIKPLSLAEFNKISRGGPWQA